MTENIYLMIVAAVAVLLMVFFIENYRSNHMLQVKKYTISSYKIPTAFHNKKIVFLSDLHNNIYGVENEKLLTMIDREEPDYILVGGDMIVARKKYRSVEILDFMKKLPEKYPVIGANGNHEERLRWQEAEGIQECGVIYENYTSELVKAGIRHLDNATIELRDGSERIFISGLCLEKKYYKKFRHVKMDIKEICSKIGNANEQDFHILLAHNPDYFESYVEWGADLTLAGHVHGGIMRLPFLGGALSPAYEIFPKYDAGLFEKDGKRMIVSTGLGCHSIKIRLFNPPQIVVIELKKEKTDE